MMRSRDALSSHSGLIPFETLCEKNRGTTLTITAIIEATKRRTRKKSSLKRFLKKKILVPRNTKAGKKRYFVVMIILMSVKHGSYITNFHLYTV